VREGNSSKQVSKSAPFGERGVFEARKAKEIQWEDFRRSLAASNCSQGRRERNRREHAVTWAMPPIQKGDTTRYRDSRKVLGGC